MTSGLDYTAALARQVERGSLSIRDALDMAYLKGQASAYDKAADDPELIEAWREARGQ